VLWTLILLGTVVSERLFAAGPGITVVNYYAMVLHWAGVHDDHMVHEWVPTLAALVTLLIITLIGLAYRSKVSASANDVRPEHSFGLRTFVEGILDFVYALGEDIIGKAEVRAFFGLLVSLFLFIFISNLSGLVPGFPPATESLNTNLAMGLVVFIMYNIAGIKEHGASYVKQFLGPIWWLAPLLVGIELVAHLARPVSLSLRLYGNIFGDHLVMSVFTGLTYVILPAFLLFFGLLVATVQSFVFTLLSSIYISMAISHDH